MKYRTCRECGKKCKGLVGLRTHQRWHERHERQEVGPVLASKAKPPVTIEDVEKLSAYVGQLHLLVHDPIVVKQTVLFLALSSVTDGLAQAHRDLFNKARG